MREACPICWAEHGPETWRCAACDVKFHCRAQFVSVPTPSGTVIRAHIRRGQPDSLGEACGPVVAVEPVTLAASSPLEHAKRHAGIA